MCISVNNTICICARSLAFRTARRRRLRPANRAGIPNRCPTRFVKNRENPYFAFLFPTFSGTLSARARLFDEFT